MKAVARDILDRMYDADLMLAAVSVRQSTLRELRRVLIAESGALAGVYRIAMATAGGAMDLLGYTSADEASRDEAAEQREDSR